jgi:putative ABC transport system ATP-binding protein
MPTTLRVARRGHNGATGEVVHRGSPRSGCLVSSLAGGVAEVQSRVVSAAPEVLRTVRLRKKFESEGAPVRALRGVDLAIASGQFVAVTGPSGCGKSTLLNLVAGLETPSDGEVFLAGESLAGKDESELAHLRRRHVGFVFQFFNLLEDVSALENVALAAVIAGVPRRSAELRARELLDLLGLPDKTAELPGVLSGGQRQRVAIARALANEPTLLLADEPTGALDSAGGLEVLELFRRLHTGGQTILLVTHDQRVADAAERVVRMQDGRIVGSTIAAPALRAVGG